MCLIKTHRLPKISRKPIQVYKIFEHDITNSVLVTPYQKQVCQVGETIKAKHSWFKGIFKDKIEGEGVHAFINKHMAKRHANYFYYFYHIYLCEIPPFTPYWVGTDDEITASKMVIKERVEL